MRRTIGCASATEFRLLWMIKKQFGCQRDLLARMKRVLSPYFWALQNGKTYERPVHDASRAPHNGFEKGELIFG